MALKGKRTVEIKAPAKINLGLKITGKRDDGYHTLQSIFVKVTLVDKIRIDYLVDKTEIIFTGPYSEGISADKNTLIKALNEFRKLVPSVPSIRVKVEKNIPHGSGLGGGSSDAAALLTFLFDTFYPSATLSQKIEMAQNIGADVPFFLHRNAAYVEGIGEKIYPLPYQMIFYGLIVFPGIRIGTAEAFKKFDLRLTQYQKNIIFNPLLSAPLPIRDYHQFLANELEEVAMDMHGELWRVREWLKDLGCEYVQMTGSGSAFYGLSSKPIELSFGNECNEWDVFFVKPFEDGV